MPRRSRAVAKPSGSCAMGTHYIHTPQLGGGASVGAGSAGGSIYGDLEAYLHYGNGLDLPTDMKQPMGGNNGGFHEQILLSDQRGSDGWLGPLPMTQQLPSPSLDVFQGEAYVLPQQAGLGPIGVGSWPAAAGAPGSAGIVVPATLAQQGPSGSVLQPPAAAAPQFRGQDGGVPGGGPEWRPAGGMGMVHVHDQAPLNDSTPDSSGSGEGAAEPHGPSAGGRWANGGAAAATGEGKRGSPGGKLVKQEIPTQRQKGGGRGSKGPRSNGHTHSDAKAANRSHLTQRRYRERQKAKTADLISQVQELKKDNDQLRSDLGDFVGRNNMMRQLLDERDEQLKKVEALRDALSDRSRGGAAMPMQAERRQNGNELAESMDSLSLTLTVQDQPICLGPERMRTLSQGDLSRLWKDYVGKLALLLNAVATAPVPPQHILDRIDQLTVETTLLLTRVAFPNPLGVKLFVSKKLEDDSSVLSREENKEGFMHTAASMGLTPEQQESVKLLRRDYLEKTHDLRLRRQPVLQALLDSQPSQYSTRMTAATYIKADKLMERLRESMDLENSHVCAFIDNLYAKILSPVQRARLIVGAYPWTPDHLAFSTAVAAQVGDPEAAASLLTYDQNNSSRALNKEHLGQS